MNKKPFLKKSKNIFQQTIAFIKFKERERKK